MPVLFNLKTTDGLRAIASAIILAIGTTTAFGQLTGTTLPAAPAPSGPTLTLPPATPAATLPAAPTLPVPSARTPAATPAATPASAVQPFVAEVAHTRVYVRSGPGVNYYELGQLTRGDTVQVVGTKNGWYTIDPPAGVYCYVAKDLVEVDSTGQTGTIKGEFVNIRAASALHPASDYVVLSIAKKGTQVAIEGSADKYYKITPPEDVHVYISAQFAKPAAAGTTYAAPTLKLPANLPVDATQPAAATTEPGTAATTEPAGPVTIVVTPHPATNFNSEARTKFTEVNNRTQSEFVKPILQEDLAGLLTDYKAILALPNIPPTVKQSCDERIALVEKRLELQNLAKEAAAPQTPEKIAEQAALNQSWEQAQAQIAAAEQNAPYVAQGELRTSQALKAKYVLVNPVTERVVAYLDPSASEIDVSPLLKATSA